MTKKKSFFQKLWGGTPKSKKPVRRGTKGPSELLKKNFDPAFYLATYPDVARAKMDPLAHYIKWGWKEGRKPAPWFDRKKYISENPSSADSEIDAFVHCLENGGIRQSEQVLETSPTSITYPSSSHRSVDGALQPNKLNAGLPKSEDLDLVRPHFDASYYVEKNGSNLESGLDPLLHFMAIGWSEGRDPSADFSCSYYLAKNKDIADSGLNPYVHYLRFGHKETWRNVASVSDAKIIHDFETDAAMVKNIAAAEKLEPMISHPQVVRKITSPLKNQLGLAEALEAIRAAVGTKRYKYVIAVPNIRMSGAARVASIFSQAMSQIRDRSEILVIVTDSDDREYQNWFPKNVRILSIPPMIAHLRPEIKMRCLIDILRGVSAETIVNINSRLLWDTMQVFGRQLSQEFKIATYFFTWDESPTGARGGYPIQWLRDTSAWHHLLLTDTKTLAQDISERLGFDPKFGPAEVLPLYTPVAPTQFKAISPEEDVAPRVLWAGRFDRQKRIDILVAIARDNPHIIFDVYGKIVLDKNGIQSLNPPSNLSTLGTYTDLATVLEVPYHGFLYTAQWDGLPTILLDMARAGLPIVAPNVGGISELIDEKTGWLVPDFTDVAQFSAALNDILQNPQIAAAKATALRAHIDDTFTEQRYVSGVKEALIRHGM